MTNAARRELVQKCRCIPNPTWGRKLFGCFYCNNQPSRCIPNPTWGRKLTFSCCRIVWMSVHPLPFTGTETEWKAWMMRNGTGASPTPPGDGNLFFWKNHFYPPLSMQPQPLTGTETPCRVHTHPGVLMQPLPHTGTETLRRISGRASPMHPQPHPGTETVRNHTRQIEARHDASPTPAPPPWDRHAHRCNPTPTRGRNHRPGTGGRIPACTCCMIGI